MRGQIKGLSDNPNLRYIVYGYGVVLGYAFKYEQAKKAVYNLHGYVHIVDQWKYKQAFRFKLNLSVCFILV